MLNQLQYGDVLVSAKDASQHLIASAKPLHGFIQVVCERTGSSQFHLYEQLKRDIATGLYRIKRKGSPKHSPLQQGDAQLDATQSRALSLCNQIKQYMHKYGVSERRAYQALTESHEGRPSVTLSTVYRYMQRLRHGLPPLRGAKNKGPRSRIQLEDRTLVASWLVSTTWSPLRGTAPQRLSNTSTKRFVLRGRVYLKNGVSNLPRH